MKKILFTSVIGPYGRDSERTRFKNPMSLLSNQVTRGQKYYTVRMCQRTFAFDLFGVNLNADVATLNFPTQRQLKATLKAHRWDRVGMSGIIPNFESLIETYRCVRRELPDVPIDVGGHICNDLDVLKELEARLRSFSPGETFSVFDTGSGPPKARGGHTTFIRRDGLDYYSNLDGVGIKEKLYAPLVNASFGKRVMGLPISSTSSGLIIPDVGCPMKCNFCATSHKFGGRFLKFLRTAEDIMGVANAHADRGKDEMFVMSENFSLDTRRCLSLLKLMEEQGRPHKFCVFSSADGLMKLGVENIVKLGYSFIWIGLEESSGTVFRKTHGIDLKVLVRDLQAHGVEVLGSTILGFPHQKLQDIDREVKHALGFECVYNQFMLYMPGPGTAFWDQMKADQKLKPDFKWADLHGQATQNWHHPYLSDEVIEKRLDRAFEQDFEHLGPSLYRMMKVHYQGYLKTKDWKHELVQVRRAKMKKMFFRYIPLLTAMAKDLKRQNHRLTDDVFELRDLLIHETGLKGRMLDFMLSPVVRTSLGIEKVRYRHWTKRRKMPNPKASLTYYGSFPRRFGFSLPRQEFGSEAHAIENSSHDQRSQKHIAASVVGKIAPSNNFPGWIPPSPKEELSIP